MIKRRNAVNILIPLWFLSLLVSCGIDDIIYIASPDQVGVELQVPLERDGILYPGPSNDDENINIIGFDVFYSFSADSQSSDNFASVLTGQSVQNFFDFDISLPVLSADGMRQYDRLFFSSADGPYSRFYTVAAARREEDFAILFEVADDGFYFNDQVDYLELNRYIQPEGSQEKILKLFSSINKTDSDVQFIEEIDSLINVYMYLYVFAVGFDSNLSVIYCDQPLRLGPYQMILR